MNEISFLTIGGHLTVESDPITLAAGEPALESALSETDRWLKDYGASHAEVTYPAIYWTAVLAVVVGTVGLLGSLPIPEAFANISPVLTWGTVFLMAAVVYYFIISISLAIGLLPFIAGIAVLQFSVARSGMAAVLFAASVGGLYLGHYRAGGVRAVARDLQLMMIAPAWILSNLYRRLGIPV